MLVVSNNNLVYPLHIGRLSLDLLHRCGSTKSRCAFKPEAQMHSGVTYGFIVEIHTSHVTYKSTKTPFRSTVFAGLYVDGLVYRHRFYSAIDTNKDHGAIKTLNTSIRFIQKCKATLKITTLKMYNTANSHTHFTDSAQPCSHSGPLWFSECKWRFL